MKNCVIKDTKIVVDGGHNDVELMLQNAKNNGYTEKEVEIVEISEEEIQKSNTNVEKIGLEYRNRADIDYLAIMQGVELL